MNQTLHLRLSQQLAMTPQLQQSIRLLQLSTAELDQELANLLADNPLLERAEAEPQSSPKGEGDAPQPASAAETDAPASEGAADADLFDWLDARPGSRREEEDDAEYSQQAAGAPTLREHLLAQLGTTRLPPRDRSLVSALIGALDERGYLGETLEDIAALLPAELDIAPEELEIALKHLQNFDPAGVGARTPAECLELQLRVLPAHVRGHVLAIRIVREHLEVLAARDFTRLKRLLRCDAEGLREAQQLIRSLNPYPGSPFSPAETHYIVADVIVNRKKNVWVASLNPEAMTRLRINPMCASVMRDRRHSGALSAQMQEARWLIKTVQQRFETILRVAQAIVDRQRHFFDHGEVAMRPLVLREIAEKLELHESTVSRVTRQKFMATPRGIFELKYFFGSQVTTDSGGACSATAIRALLKQLVQSEDRRRPLSDGKIARILGEQGIVVARRTIAKYRETLRLPPANLRATL